MTFVRNPVILALDVDTIEDARKILDHVGDMIGGVKVGPRLVYKYGASLVQEFSEIAPVFVDNKYFDIPSTMESAVRASFQAGATLVTVHALAGLVALTGLAALEIELNRIRPFKILAVTILTSWENSSFPENFHSWTVENHVRSLSQLVYRSGLRGLVCSGHELEFLSQKDFFKVVPGIRLSSDEAQDQKRVMTPKQAMKSGAQALVVGRTILKSTQPRQTILEILESC
ncbi:MAG: orotidine 5'-phosphate decarboxylase [Bdellovibrionales bacterium RIFCSPHIGHO2_01_FULL_40_29]|nr:MAG: orotidine 5'-phosphate decarboxylase [Bdellovibrionales bacterium RIFCSPHIGHO2_01_FULL_40_29]OFZ33934.1 MAG: orotidine 5'-phosphate decarboxylase [Bdellovibrionales bacterium RIFCSPHIGHO2_02_FULL_40_15]